MIPLMKVHMLPKDELMPALEKVLYSGMVTEGESVIEFEEKFQQWLGDYGLKDPCNLRPLSTNSCTSALQLSYRAAGIRDKIVLATPMTCTATNMPIFMEGGQIAWCDIDPTTGNISVDSVCQKINELGPERIGAISFADFAGYPADLEQLINISKEFNIPLVEDSAQSLGASYCGNKIGTIEAINFTCFSFQAIKHMTTIDGGAVICQSEKDWELVKRLKWYGINREAVKEATRFHYDIPDWGYKAHMNNINAVIGIKQLNYITNIIQHHQTNGWFFDVELYNVDGITTMRHLDNTMSSYWIYMAKVEDREGFAKMMLDAGIGVNIAHIRNDQYTCFKDKRWVINAEEERPGLEDFTDKYISIPCGWWVTPKDAEYIVETIKGGW